MNDADKVTKEAERMILVSATENLRRAVKEYDKAFQVGLSLHNTRKYGKANPTTTEIAGLTEGDCRCEMTRRNGKVYRLPPQCKYHKLKAIDEHAPPEWIAKVEDKYGK